MRRERWKREVAVVPFGSFVSFFGWILFGNFVFLGLRYNSGIRRQGEVDSYLHGGNGSLVLTDYNFSLVVQDSILCSATWLTFLSTTRRFNNRPNECLFRDALLKLPRNAPPWPCADRLKA